MIQKKPKNARRRGRPSTVAKPLDYPRVIPLAMPHGDVLEIDAAAARAGMSRAAWVRATLKAAAAADGSST